MGEVEPKWRGVAIIAAGVLLAGAGAWFGWRCTRAHDDVFGVRVYVVDTSTPGMRVELDGRTVAEDMQIAKDEAQANASMKHAGVREGSHTIVAYDAANNEIDRVEFVSVNDDEGFLFAPRADPSICFVSWTDQYHYASKTPRTEKGPPPKIEILPKQSFVTMHGPVDTWLGHNPQRVRDDKYDRTTRTAVRMLRCDAPELSSRR